MNHRAMAQRCPLVTAFTPCGFSVPEEKPTALPHWGCTSACRRHKVTQATVTPSEGPRVTQGLERTGGLKRSERHISKPPPAPGLRRGALATLPTAP